MADRIIIFGSRLWPETYYSHILERIRALPLDAVIVHGACPTGADAMANQAARLRGMTIEPHPAAWLALGRAAGPIRNRHMAELGATLAIGFRMPGKSAGTDGMWGECMLRNIPVERHGWDWPVRW